MRVIGNHFKVNHLLLEFMYQQTGRIGNQSLLDLTGKKGTFFNGRMDELIHSQPVQKMGKKRAVKGCSVNTMADKAVNMKPYIDAAKANNKKLIENAGDKYEDFQ